MGERQNVCYSTRPAHKGVCVRDRKGLALQKSPAEKEEAFHEWRGRRKRGLATQTCRPSHGVAWPLKPRGMAAQAGLHGYMEYSCTDMELHGYTGMAVPGMCTG